MSEVLAAVAASRYGLGPRPGELARLGGDPKGWLAAQIAGTPPVLAALARRDGSRARITAVFEARAGGNAAVGEFLRSTGRDWHLADVTARTAAAVETETPYFERLVHFWSNHFTVSTAKPALIVGALPYETEAIRPHVLGRFADMLITVASHPAMLVYLDNAQSVGPDSFVGQRRDMGLNENLAREILELHTLGVDGGYGQHDVRALAEIITGWSVAREDDSGAGGFMFRPRIHQPGPKTLLGVRYEENGQQEGIAALTALARHPSTARHVATKLARHFIADDPPAAAVGELAGVFQATGGDLRAMAAALIDWLPRIEDPLGKVRSPHDFVVATLRAFDAAEHAERGAMSMRLMGQFPFSAPSPAGWPDEAEDWLGPDALMKRIDWAMAVGQRMPAMVDPLAFARQTIWPLASEATLFHIQAAPSVAEGVALLLASPEFQRR